MVTNVRQAADTCTPAAQHIIGQYYQFLRLGFSGYKRIISSCTVVAMHTAEKIEALGAFSVVSVCLPTPTWQYSRHSSRAILRTSGDPTFCPHNQLVSSFELFGDAGTHCCAVSALACRSLVSHEMSSHRFFADDLLPCRRGSRRRACRWLRSRSRRRSARTGTMSSTSPTACGSSAGWCRCVVFSCAPVQCIGSRT